MPEAEVKQEMGPVETRLREIQGKDAWDKEDVDYLLWTIGELNKSCDVLKKSNNKLNAAFNEKVTALHNTQREMQYLIRWRKRLKKHKGIELEVVDLIGEQHKYYLDCLNKIYHEQDVNKMYQIAQEAVKKEWSTSGTKS